MYAAISRFLLGNCTAVFFSAQKESFVPCDPGSGPAFYAGVSRKLVDCAIAYVDIVTLRVPQALY
jgi:hypothetical protein